MSCEFNCFCWKEIRTDSCWLSSINLPALVSITSTSLDRFKELSYNKNYYLNDIDFILNAATWRESPNGILLLTNTQCEYFKCNAVPFMIMSTLMMMICSHAKQVCLTNNSERTDWKSEDSLKNLESFTQLFIYCAIAIRWVSESTEWNGNWCGFHW